MPAPETSPDHTDQAAGKKAKANGKDKKGAKKKKAKSDKGKKK